MTEREMRKKIRQAVEAARKECPLVPSITNTVTINLVANAQLACGGSAAMVYLPDEGKQSAAYARLFISTWGRCFLCMQKPCLGL